MVMSRREHHRWHSPSRRAGNVTRRGEARPVTAALSAGAFIALVNAAVCGVRAAIGTGGHDLWLRFTVALAVAVSLAAWAGVRVRARVLVSRVDAALPPEGAETASPAARPPRTGPRAWLGHARWLLGAVLIGAAAVSISDEWGTLQGALAELAHLHWSAVRWAIYAEGLAILSLAWLTRILLHGGRRRLSLSSVLGITLAGNALSLSVPGGPAWAATFSFDQLRRRGVSRALAGWVLMLNLVLSTLALLALLLVGTFLAGDRGPSAPFLPIAVVFSVAGTITALALVVCACLPPVRAAACRACARLRPTGRFAALAGRAASQFAGVDCPHRTLLNAFAAAVLNWVTDCACLVASIVAVSGHVPWRGVLVVYAVTQIGQAIPLTPGGLGVVEATASLLLVAYGMPSDTALAAVLVYRIISFWILVPIGWGAMGALLLAARRGAARAGRIPAQAPRVGHAARTPAQARQAEAA